MKQNIIEVKNISKKYKIGSKQTNNLLRDAIVDLFKKSKDSSSKDSEKQVVSEDKEFWALKDISFNVREGDIVGIIGKNGAGKSTLLKIISRITPPTGGNIKIRGSVASLLEIGTGFHPELTGRENIFLNGVILGMTMENIKKKYRSIVEFSGIEKFIDTRVKFYSSGMYTRLAFAVAVHVDSDILIVDEVLSVGDYDFQKKSLNKISNISKKGRTILFVSHSLQAVSSLCERIILLEEGKLIEDGKTRDVLKRYLGTTNKTKAFHSWPNLRLAPGNEFVKLRYVCIKDQSGKINKNIDIRNQIKVEIEYRVFKSGILLNPSIELFNESDIPVFSSNDTETRWLKKTKEKGDYISRVIIPGNFLSGGEYKTRIVLGSLFPYQKHISQFDVVRFNIVDSPGDDTARGSYRGTIPGVVRPILEWKTDIK